MSTTKVNKSVKKLSNIERAYIAGIIDGEGSVTLSTKQKGATRHLAVTVSNTDLTLLRYLLEVIGVGKVTNKRTYKAHHTPSYTYAIYNRQALDLLKQIKPYLQTYKSKRAELVLKQYVKLTPRNGKYTTDMTTKREKFVEEFFAILP